MSSVVGKFLHQRDPNFHHSPEVEMVYGYLRQNGEHIPNDPDEKIVANLGFLANKDYADDGVLTGNSESIGRQVEHLIVGSNDVSESYFDLQRRIAREELGLGDIVITEQEKRQWSEVVREDQRATLSMWAEYLNNQETGYEDWFKHYAFHAVAKLTEYDPRKEQFRRRSNGTAANFPDLSQEALAYVYDVLKKTHIDEDGVVVAEATYDKSFLELAKTGNFGKIYAYAYKEFASRRKEAGGTTEGSWKKYSRTTDMDTVRELTKTLLGHGTTWCVAGESTALKYLSNGDFYIYYSQDKDGNDTIPRIAISSQYGKVTEVRGIEPGQHMETAVTDIALAKLTELPGGESYLETAKDMKRLTEIDRRHQAGLAIDPHDIFFLRQYIRPIKGFGYFRADPRIEQLLHDRDPQTDFDLMLKTYGHKSFADSLLEAEKVEMVLANLDKFESGAVDQRALVKWLAPTTWNSRIGLIAQYLDKFDDGIVNHFKLAERLIVAGKVESIIENIDKFKPGSIDYEELMDTSLISYSELVDKNIDIFLGKLPHKIVAERLILKGRYGTVADNLDLFEEGSVDVKQFGVQLATSLRTTTLMRNLDKFIAKVEGRQFALALLQNGAAAFIAENIAAFGLDLDEHKKIAENLINSDDPSALAANLRSFKKGSIDQSLLVARLITCRKAKVLCENLASFDPGSYDTLNLVKDILSSNQAEALFSKGFNRISAEVGDKKFATMLLESGNAQVLNKYSYRFRRGTLDHDILANAMIESGRGDLVIKNYGKFDLKTMDALDIASRLIERDEVNFISSKFRLFLTHIEHPKLVKLLMDAGRHDMVANNLQKFSDGSVDYESLASHLIDDGNIDSVSKNLGKFLSRVDNTWLSNKLISSGNGAVVATHFSKFEEGAVDEEALAKSLIHSARAEVLVATVDITSLDTSQQEIIILDLIRNGKTRQALSKLEQLAAGVVDSKKLASALLSKGNEESVARSLEKFEPGTVDHKALAANLIKSGKAHVVVTHFSKFEAGAIDHKMLASKLIKQGDDELVIRIIGKLEPGTVNFMGVARRLISAGWEEIIIRNLKSLVKTVKPEVIAEAFIAGGGAYQVEDNLDAFLTNKDDSNLANTLYELGFGYIVENNRSKFKIRQSAEVI